MFLKEILALIFHNGMVKIYILIAKKDHMYRRGYYERGVL